MTSLLRTTAALCFVWSVVLTAGRGLIATEEQQTALAQALAHGQGASLLVLALFFWRGAAEAKPSPTVIAGAVLFLLLRVSTDLYDLLVLVDAMNGMVSLADLVLSMVLTVGIVETAPRVLRPPDEKGAEGH